MQPSTTMIKILRLPKKEQGQYPAFIKEKMTKLGLKRNISSSMTVPSLLSSDFSISLRNVSPSAVSKKAILWLDANAHAHQCVAESVMERVWHSTSYIYVAKVDMQKIVKDLHSCWAARFSADVYVDDFYSAECPSLADNAFATLQSIP
ncbi:unnamed protein product [Porites lobata]|uniref:Uncharacterized protein n=1 Tax=Porites lobata TaxID=104759 RepID=A0ABN8PBM5_9CNID|nr:unnamed protein product [Porites lobata]